MDPASSLLRDVGLAELALFLDVDGTLLDIAPHPDVVRVDPRLLRDLAAASHALNGALALMSGRSIKDLDELFAPLRLAAGGVHGAELRRCPNGSIAWQVPGQLTEDAWHALGRLLTDFPGSFAENKGVSFAVHYPVPGTDVPRLRRALASLADQVADPGQALQIVAGDAVFEIQLQGFDKGRAIACFMAEDPFRARRPVFIGDDEIDRPGFDKALALGGLAFSVGAELPGVSGTFAGPEAVRAWLHGLSR